MPTSFLAFSLFVGAVVAVSWAVVFGRPMVARARFTMEVSRLRDRVEDMVFLDELPDEEPVQFFWSKMTALMQHPELISLSQALALEAVPPSQPAPPVPSLADLKPEAREKMHALQDEFHEVMTDYLCNGSSVWPVMAIVRRLPARRETVPAASTETIVAHYDATLDRARERDENGLPEFSPRLLSAAF